MAKKEVKSLLLRPMADEEYADMAADLIAELFLGHWECEQKAKKAKAKNKETAKDKNYFLRKISPSFMHRYYYSGFALGKADCLTSLRTI